MRRLTGPAELRAALPRLFAPAAGRRGVGLAVSGGADSLALLLLAVEWAGALAHPPPLFVYSVDHGLRPEAAAEAAFVVREAGRLGLAARALRWTGDKPTAGLQAAARAARYRLIGEAMAADGADLLLTAHHRDDQAETVLMRLAHGSGLDGLRGMDAMGAVEGVPVFRPLLDIAPDLLGAVVAAAGLTPVADPSNLDPHYERVRWRQALPPLAALGLDSAAVAQFARRAGEADAAIGEWAAERFAALAGLDGLGAVRLPAGELARLPRAVGIKLVGRALELAGGSRRPRALGVVERLHASLVDGAAFAGRTVLGASVRRRADTVWFSREPGRQGTGAAVVAASASLLWDGRFRIANRSAAPFSVRMAGELSRQAAELLLGQTLLAPSSAIRSAPLVSTAAGEVLALGGYRLGDGVEVELATPRWR